MKSLLILVLTMAFYATVICGDSSSGFDDELLTTDVKQILNRKVVQNMLEQSNHQIETLQTQVQNQNANLEKLQHQVSLFSEANERKENQIKALKAELEQLKANENPLQTTLNKVEQPSTTPQQNQDSSKGQSHEETESDLQWKPWSLNEQIPQNAVEAGYDSDKAPIYVGRSYVNGSHIITKVIPDRPAAYYSFQWREYSVRNCEILTGSGFSWVGTYSGYLPQNAVSSGKWINDVPHFIGRATYNSEELGSSRIPGTIQGESGILYLPFGGREHEYRQYDVLVQNQNSEEHKENQDDDDDWSSETSDWNIRL